MEHITIIFSNAGDPDCERLRRLWRNIPEYMMSLIEINPEDTDWEDMVDSALSKEDDTLLLCGHGTAYGLLFPRLDYSEYIIHPNNKDLINAKNVICIWCHASSFGTAYNIAGFYTSMFISNINEAYDNGCCNSTDEQIARSNTMFMDRVNYMLRNDVPMSEWVMILGAKSDVEDEIDKFNYSGLMLI